MTAASGKGLSALRYAFLLGTSLCAGSLCAGQAAAQATAPSADSVASRVGYLAPPASTTYDNVTSYNTPVAGIVAVSGGTDAVRINNGATITSAFGVAVRGAAPLVGNLANGTVRFGQVGIALDSIGGTGVITNLGAVTRPGGIPNVDLSTLAVQLGPTFGNIGTLIAAARAQLSVLPADLGLGIGALAETGSLNIQNGGPAAGGAPTVNGAAAAVALTAAGTLGPVSAALSVPSLTAGYINAGASGIGIGAVGLGSGNITISNTGTIVGGSAGIVAFSPAAGSSLQINNIGSILSSNGQAILANGIGGSVSVTNNGVLLGASGIEASGSSVRIVNAASGQIYGGQFTFGPNVGVPGFAINTRGNGTAGPSLVDNFGIVYGRIALSDGSTFNNQSSASVFLTRETNAFNISANTSRYSTFNNYGSVSLAQTITQIATTPTQLTGGVAANATTFTSAPSGIVAAGGFPATGPISAVLDRTNFNNYGIIALGTGSAANRLTINGDYTGMTGAQLQLQASTQANTADRLVITGNAAGTTGITVNNLTPGVTLASTGPVLVQVAGNLPSTAFTLAGLRNFGTLQGTLVNGTVTEGATTYKTLSLGATPNAVAASGPTTVVVTQTIAQQGTTTVLDRVSQVRENFQRADAGTPSQLPGQPMQYTALVSKDPIAQNVVQPTAPVDTSTRVASWVRATGDIERRTGVGSSFGAGGAFSRTDLGYTQETGGLLGGTDVVISGLTKKDDGLILGLLGGYTIATVNLNQNAGRQNYEGGTVGAYATYLNGPAFIDALFKVDLLGLDIIAPGLRQATSLQNYSFASNVGYRIPLASAVYVEPTAGIDYVYTDFNRNSAMTTTAIALRDGDAFRGRIGARVGSEVMIGDVRIEPSVTSYIYSTLYQSNVRGAVNGLSSVTGIRDEGKIRGEVQASVNFFNLKTGVSGFVRADYRVGGDLIGGGGRIGLRYQW